MSVKLRDVQIKMETSYSCPDCGEVRVLAPGTYASVLNSGLVLVCQACSKKSGGCTFFACELDGTLRDMTEEEVENLKRYFNKMNEHFDTIPSHIRETWEGVEGAKKYLPDWLTKANP